MAASSKKTPKLPSPSHNGLIELSPKSSPKSSSSSSSVPKTSQADIALRRMVKVRRRMQPSGPDQITRGMRSTSLSKRELTRNSLRNEQRRRNSTLSRYRGEFSRSRKRVDNRNQHSAKSKKRRTNGSGSKTKKRRYRRRSTKRNNKKKKRRKRRKTR